MANQLAQTWVPTPNQMRFMVWTLTPEDRRDPPTQKEFADLLKVSEQTLINWKHHPRWQEYRNVFIMMKLNAKIPDIINALVDDLTAPGNWQARRDFIRYGMPFMGHAMQDPRIQAIQQADMNLLPQKSIEEVLSALPEEHQDSVVSALLQLGAIQANEAEMVPASADPALVSLSPALDYGQYTRQVQDVHEADADEAEDWYEPVSEQPAHPPRKLKRPVTPLRSTPLRSTRGQGSKRGGRAR